MTIREHLAKYIRLFMSIAFASWALIAVLIIVGGVAKVPVHEAFFILGFAGFMGGVLCLMAKLRCPRCDGRLGEVAFGIWRPINVGKPVNFCPFCGVNLDEPLDPGAASD